MIDRLGVQCPCSSCPDRNTGSPKEWDLLLILLQALYLEEMNA